jgi:hypothetical protein
MMKLLFRSFYRSNPETSQKYEQYKTKAYAMAKGGYVRKYDGGGNLLVDLSHQPLIGGSDATYNTTVTA